RPILRWSFISFLTLFFMTLLLQFILWKQYSLEATYVQLKNLLVKESIENHLELGAICNSLSDHFCAQNYFQKVVDMEPNNKLGLANLAMVLAKQHKWQLAEPNFKAYFSLGGSSYDVLYWYGLTESVLKDVKEGMLWVAHALKTNPHFLPAGKKLVSYYLENQQRTLALSVVGSLTRGHPENYKEWNDFLNRKEYITSEGDSAAESSWTLMSLDGNNYYLPLVLRKNTRLKFFSVFDDVKYNLINKDTLNELLVPISEKTETKSITFNDRLLKVYLVSFPEVLVAGKNIGKVEFYACDSCPNIIGKDFLKDYNYQHWSENYIYYLSIQDPKGL
ncbi:MAG: hypothetical protein KDD40_10155, partial [Bdellovibrionales bacterium]|nr:hypothetical protein [Bdellovibrionales bacterium]